MNENKICFIICANNELFLQECILYINQLEVPAGYTIDVISVQKAKSMAAGYNEGMQSTDAKYKVYLHQDVFICYRGFLKAVLDIFSSDQSIGMIGMVGAPWMAEDGVMWHAVREGGLLGITPMAEPYATYEYHIEDGLHEVEAVDGLLIVTNRDIQWREDVFDGWDFYDVSQSMEFRRKGYKVVVPEQRNPWCDHYDGDRMNLLHYDKYRKRCMAEYPEGFDAAKKLKPKPKLELKWYHNEDLYSDGDVEELNVQLLAMNAPENYVKAIHDYYCWPIYYHLTHTRKNILNWYPFDSEASVLEIGCGLGAITGVLCDKCRKVTAVELSKRRATGTLFRCREKENLEIIVGNLNDIEFEEKFDYITLIGVLEYQGSYTATENPYLDFLKKVKTLLKPEGHLLVAIENQYGLKYWCGAREDHTQIPFDGLNQYSISRRAVRTFSKEALQQLLTESGFAKTYFYYPMPDYKLPTVIYSQEKLPADANMYDANYYYSPDSKTLIAEEKSIYEDLIKNKVFEFFANSFLVECTETGEVGEVNFARLNTLRKSDYQIGTRMYRNGTVEKFPLTNGAKEHIAHIKRSESDFKESGLKILESRESENGLLFDYVNKKTLDELVVEACKMGDNDRVYEIFDRVYEDILHSSEKLPGTENILFTLMDMPQGNIDKYGPILKKGYLDMTLSNGFWSGKEILWFDQEWVLKGAPAKYILFRVMNQFYVTHGEIYPAELLYQRYDMHTCLEEFGSMEHIFFDNVIDRQHVGEIMGFCGENRENITANIQKLLNT